MNVFSNLSPPSEHVGHTNSCQRDGERDNSEEDWGQREVQGLSSLPQ